jgi:hypothetical protein
MVLWFKMGESVVSMALHATRSSSIPNMFRKFSSTIMLE